MCFIVAVMLISVPVFVGLLKMIGAMSQSGLPFICVLHVQYRLSLHVSDKKQVGTGCHWMWCPSWSLAEIGLVLCRNLIEFSIRVGGVHKC